MDTLENYPSPSVDRDSLNDFERLIEPLKSSDRAIVCLAYVWGFKGKEIADLFGVTESRISQRIESIQKSLSQTVAVQELNPVERVRQEVEEIRESQREVQRELEAFLQAQGTDRSKLEREADRWVEAEKSWALAGDHAQGVPEWFA
jgi:predicted transcriptional regulator